jgi:hypothetical protein
MVLLRRSGLAAFGEPAIAAVLSFCAGLRIFCRLTRRELPQHGQYLRV